MLFSVAHGGARCDDLQSRRRLYGCPGSDVLRTSRRRQLYLYRLIDTEATVDNIYILRYVHIIFNAMRINYYCQRSGFGAVHQLEGACTSEHSSRSKEEVLFENSCLSVTKRDNHAKISAVMRPHGFTRKEMIMCLRPL